MKIVTLSCISIGLLSALMAGLTALGVVPGFVDFGFYDLIGLDVTAGNIAGTGIDTLKDIMTTFFWGGLSVLVLLAAIGFAVVTPKE